MPRSSNLGSVFVGMCLIMLLFPMPGYSESSFLTPSTAPAPNQVVYVIRPSDTDPAIRDFNDPNYVIFNKDQAPLTPLVVFLPGTDGEPRNTPFFTFIANLGYRVINLEYNNTPAVNNVCPKDPNPDCSALFRQDRIYGGGVSNRVTTPLPETIVNRLVRVLDYLDRMHPEEGWRSYLINGKPNWPSIVISGLSQGAGMAALIAKQEIVDRVVLFSSPWDFTGPREAPAPWLYKPSATPSDRWYAAYHARENTVKKIQSAYSALGIPQNQIIVFNADLLQGKKLAGNNPFHVSTVRNTSYAPEWQHLFGQPPK